MNFTGQTPSILPTAIVGGGMVGDAIASLLRQRGVPVEILKGFRNGDGRTLPAGIRQVIYTAQSRDSASRRLTDDLTFVNVELVNRIARDAAAAGVERFCFFSTGSVYAPSPSPVSENSPLQFAAPSPYVATKLAAEALVRAHRAEFARTVILRPFAMFGPGQHPSRLFARIAEMIRRGDEIELNDGRGLVTNPIHCRDAARFAVEATSGGEGLETFNLAGPESVDLRWISERLAAAISVAPKFTIKEGPATVALGDVRAMRERGFVWREDLGAALMAIAAEVKSVPQLTG